VLFAFVCILFAYFIALNIDLLHKNCNSFFLFFSIFCIYNKYSSIFLSVFTNVLTVLLKIHVSNAFPMSFYAIFCIDCVLFSGDAACPWNAEEICPFRTV